MGPFVSAVCDRALFHPTTLLRKYCWSTERFAEFRFTGIEMGRRKRVSFKADGKCAAELSHCLSPTSSSHPTEDVTFQHLCKRCRMVLKATFFEFNKLFFRINFLYGFSTKKHCFPAGEQLLDSWSGPSD